MVLQKPLTAIFAAFLLLLLEPYTLAFPSLKFASCCYSLSKDVVPNPVGSYIAGLNTLESTVGGIARKQIVLYDGISCGFCYRSSCRYLSLSTSSWERQKLNRPRKQAIGLDFSCGAFCISTPGPYDGGRSWRRWQGVVYAVMKHVIPLIPQRTLHLIACVTAVELAKNEAKVQIEALPLELQPKAKVLFNDSASLVSCYMLQLMDMDWDVSRLVMQEWEAWRNRSESGIAISASSFAWNELEHSPPGPGIIARDAARLYREVTVMDLVTWTNNIRSFLESTVSRLLTQVAKTDQDALDSAVVKKLETQGASALTVSEFFDLCSGGRVPKQYIENLLCIFVQDDVESPSTHLHHHQTISSGGSEMCELALHEMWDKLKLQSSKGQVAITRAATDAVRSLRSNSIVLVRSAVTSSIEAISVALQQLHIHMASAAPSNTILAAQEGFKWLKTTFEDCSNAFEKVLNRVSHVLRCNNPSQFLTRVKCFHTAVDGNATANNTCSCDDDGLKNSTFHPQ